jgi:hypothetical protein
MSRIRLNNKIAIVAQGGDGGDGHSGLSQQPAMKLMTLIGTMVLQKVSLVSFVSVDCCLVSRFKDLVEMAPQWPW